MRSNGKNIIKKIFSPIVFVGMQIVITIIFLYFLFNFAVLLDMYMYVIIATVIILCMITVLLQLKAKNISVRSVISRIIAVVVNIILFLSVLKSIEVLLLLIAFSVLIMKQMLYRLLY